MKTILTKLLAATALAAATSPSLADSHGGGEQMAEADRTVTVVARDAEDGRMLYEPASIEVEKGTVLKIVLRNEGKQEHELFIGTPDEVEEHAEAMEEGAEEEEHEELLEVEADPGEEASLVWEAAETGTFTYACLIPGHIQAGMVGTLTVVEAPAKN